MDEVIGADPGTHGEGRRAVIRPEVRELAEMGTQPSSDVAAKDIVRLEEYQRLLESMEKPVDDEEARVLLRLFGPDERFGLAWALVHLVESTPGWPLIDGHNRGRDRVAPSAS